jgi:hypothetical protein
MNDDTSIEDALAHLKRSDRSAYLEQRIFVLSPFGVWTTAAILFAALLGLYVAAALISGVPLFTTGDGSPALDHSARIAFAMAAMMTVILSVQRYTRIRERADMTAAASIFRGGLITVLRVAELTPTGARLGLAAVAGILLGGTIVAFTFGKDPQITSHPALLAWFTVVTMLLTMSFTRGVELTRRGSTSGYASLQSDLIIDLLRIDRLSFLGRSAARFALIWFAIGAASFLFFVSSGINAFTISLIAVLVLIGAATFFGMLERVHRRIRAVKTVELEKVRSEIDSVRGEAIRDAGAAQRLAGLLAYETRISAAPEWPFDQTTLVRVFASAFILALPWFGQAIASYLIEHLAPR